VFAFQLGRVFIVIETCAHHKSTGYTLQHCKDTPGTMPRTPVLAEGVSPAEVLTAPEPRWETSSYSLDIKEDVPLSPFFHPPKKSS